VKRECQRRMCLSVLLTIVVFTVSVWAAPETLVQSVTNEGETITLRMTRESVRGPNFEVRVQNSSGGYDVHSPAEIATYIGTVDEYPDAVAAGILKSDGDLWTRIYFDRGYTLFTLGDAKDTRITFHTGDVGELGKSIPAFTLPTLPSVIEGQAGVTTYRWDVAIDTDYDFYSGTGGSDVAQTLENIEFSVMQVKAIHLTNLLLNPAMGRIIIRTSQVQDPYRVEYVGDSDIAVQGTVTGSHVNAQYSDDSYESITEVRQGDVATGYSTLEHKWTIDVTEGVETLPVTFYVEAYQTASGDGDNFTFAYSTDDSVYTNMVTVSKTSDNNLAQSYALPTDTKGIVYIKVFDTDSTPGNQIYDTLFIDRMHIHSFPHAGTFLNNGTYGVVPEWYANHAGANRDVTALASPNIGGGLAYVASIGNAFSVNGSWGDGSFDLTFRHEVGHNWGAYDLHADSPEGYTLMCGNDFGRYAGPTIEFMFDERDRKLGLLDSQGTYSTIDLPPYAALDVANVMIESGNTVTIDVLANDYDVNGDILTIDSFESTSEMGGTITRSVGTGPGGRDELTYSMDSQPGLTDNFYYTVIDSAGSTASGVALVYHHKAKTLAGYWKLNESTGTDASDSSGNGFTGALQGGQTFDSDSISGQYDTALDFDGIDDYVTLTDLNLNTDTVTFTAWVKRGSANLGVPPNYWPGLVYSYDGYTDGGLIVSSSNKLAYIWKGYNWDWNSGLILPLNTWTFAALVIEPDKATIYMDSGSGLTSNTHTAVHDSQSFSGTTCIGQDARGDRIFKGGIDDVRIYNYALTAEEIADIRDGGKAANPNPFDKMTEVGIDPTLSWAPHATATNRDVYFGTSQAAVEDANTLSPEHKGLQTETTYKPDVLSPNSTYFWRIDEVSGTPIKGDVWQFTTGMYRQTEINLKAHYSFDTDDIVGSTALDRSVPPYYDGNITNSPSVVAGRIGQALSFNGSNNYVAIPRMIEDSFSISMWVKTLQTGGTPNWYNGKGLVDAECGGVTYDFGTSLIGSKFGFGVNSPTITSTTAINNDQWHHCVATRSAITGEMKVYVDGGPAESSTTATTLPLTAPTRITIGMIQTNNNYFNGQLDDIAIWDRVLSQSEIQDINDLGPLGESFVENNLPVFTINPFSKSDAREGNSYADSIADSATDSDVDDILSYTVESGSAWLEMTPNGVLAGVPTDGAVGTDAFAVRVHDGHGGYDDATMNIDVINTYSGDMGMPDFASFAEYWLETSCPAESPCDPADINADGQVDFDDLIRLVTNWL